MAQGGQEYYGYLFKSDKKPTKVLDALLRGIANYIVESVGNKEEKSLTPAKLASFYKAVGGNYDSLFVDVPSPSISWIYASIGCQHTLQPTSDDFQPPSIPALTERGFVRWQSIEILLGPEEHVPFIQTAVREFAIKDPDTGATFPINLPTEAFPLVADKDIERWHNACAEKLRRRATPNEDEEGSRPDLPPRPKVRTGMAYVRPGGIRNDYFEPKSRSRPIPYQHVSAASNRPTRPKLSRSPSHQARQFRAPEAPSSPYARGRRRSVPENISSPSSPLVTDSPPQPAVQPAHVRRHSHPRHARRGSRSSDASSSSEGNGADDPPSPKNVGYFPGVAAGLAAGAAGAAATRRPSHPHAGARDEPPVIRFPPPAPSAQSAAASPIDARPRRRISRDRAASALLDEEEAVRRQSTGFAIPIDLTGKLSAPFLLGNRTNGARERERERERPNNSKGSTVTWKDLRDVPADEAWRRGSKSSEEDRTSPKLSRKSSRHESDREAREKEKERDSGSSESRRRRPRERDDGLEGEKARPMLRERRYSSHEDVMQRRRDRDRDREHERDRERERDLVGRAFRDRDRDRERRGASPVVRGVDGRKYPPVR